MPKFSRSSRDKLAECHEDLQVLFNEVIRYYDCTITCGYRSKEEQNKAFTEGKSKLKFPNSKHNKKPSIAVDAVPYEKTGVDWDLKQALFFSGFVKGIADRLYSEGIIKHKVKAGADWNMNYDINDEIFIDYFHFELVL